MLESAMRILVVEDEKKVARFIERGLKEERFAVDVAHDGEAGLELALLNPYDLVVLDVLLPKKDGFQVLAEIRAAQRPCRVLMLTARDSVEDRVRGLDTGADDYLTKPFAFSELQARLEAIMRRGSAKAIETVLRVADLEFDLLSREVRRAGRRLELLPREMRLLEYLMRHAGQVVTRTMLLEAVWDYHFDPQTNVIDVHVSRLRQKLDRGFARPLIHTIRGAGYSLRADP